MEDRKTKRVRPDGGAAAAGGGDAGGEGYRVVPSEVRDKEVVPMMGAKDVASWCATCKREHGRQRALSTVYAKSYGIVGGTPAYVGDGEEFRWVHQMRRTRKTLSANTMHSVAVDFEGHVWLWGISSGITGVPSAMKDGLGGGEIFMNNDDLQRECEYEDPFCIRHHMGGHDIVSVSAGLRHTLTLDNAGRVWAFGDNRHGQCSPSAVQYYDAPVQIAVIQPGQPVEDSIPIVAIEASNTRSYLVDWQGNIWSCSFNRNPGEQWLQFDVLGVAMNMFSGHNPIFKPIDVVAACDYDIFPHDRKPGSAPQLRTYGIFGIGSQGEVYTARAPTLDAPSKTGDGGVLCISGASLSDRCTIATDFDENDDGSITTNIVLLNERTKFFMFNESETRADIVGLGGGEARKVSSNVIHTLVVDTDRRAWSWGRSWPDISQRAFNRDDAWRLLGFGDLDDDAHEPLTPMKIPVEAFDGLGIVDVETAYNRSYAVDEEGHIWTWGCGHGLNGSPKKLDDILMHTQ